MESLKKDIAYWHSRKKWRVASACCRELADLLAAEGKEQSAIKFEFVRGCLAGCIVSYFECAPSSVHSVCRYYRKSCEYIDHVNDFGGKSSSYAFFGGIVEIGGNTCHVLHFISQAPFLLDLSFLFLVKLSL